jgi:hypothetical protein
MEEVAEGLLRALAETVRPFARRLLALGIPFGRVEAQLRELFVEVAEKDFALPGRRPTDSRIALVTGINRKEVRRIRSAPRGRTEPRAFGMSLATSLIGRWLADPRATDRRGMPLPIPYQSDGGPSFVELARQVTRDLAPRVLLDELLRSGAAELHEGNLVALRTDSYVPRRSRPQELRILAEDPPELVETILRNILDEGPERLLQRKVYYDNIGSEAAAAVRREMRREGEKFLRRVNRLLARYDRDRNPRAPGGERHYAAVGVYFHESRHESRQGATARALPARARLRSKKR